MSCDHVRGISRDLFVVVVGTNLSRSIHVWDVHLRIVRQGGVEFTLFGLVVVVVDVEALGHWAFR